MSSTSNGVIWLWWLRGELGVHVLGPTLLNVYNSTIQITTNPRERAKHIEVDYHFIFQLVISSIIYLQHVPSRESCAPSSAWFTCFQVEASSKSTLIWVGSLEVWWVAHQNTHSPHDQSNWPYQAIHMLLECTSLRVGVWVIHDLGTIHRRHLLSYIRVDDWFSCNYVVSHDHSQWLAVHEL